MRTLSLLALLSLAGFAALAPEPVMAQRYGQVIRCESYDFRDNYCPADTRGGVRIARQVSRTACYEGESWGYDRRGIWVTNGCAAEFEVGGGGYGGRYGDRGGRGRDPGWRGEGYGGGGGGYGRGGGGGRIVCESRDFRYRYCAAPVGRDVDLVYQISKTECRYGRSWGWDRGGVWVDRGCAAEFAIY